MKYYIGERRNPQLKNPYYVCYGKLTKTAAKNASNCVYGSMYMTAYDTEQEYEATKQELINAGKLVRTY